MTKFMNYSIYDSIALLNIINKTNIINEYISVAKELNCSIFDVFNKSHSKLITNKLNKDFIKQNILL